MTHSTVDVSSGVFDALQRSDLFRSLSDATLREVAAGSSIRTFCRGERLWDHGCPSSALGVVAAGRVKC